MNKKKIQNSGQVGSAEMQLRNPLMLLIKLARYKFYSKMMSKNDIVLDLGCGQGVSTNFYSKYCKFIYGVDLYSTFVPSLSKNIKFIEANLDDVNKNYFKKKITFIALNDVIEHFSKSKGEKILKKCRSILSKKGDVLMIGTPSKYSSMYRSEESKNQHIYEYTPEELNKICNKYFNRVFQFSMNDEVVNTGFSKLSWFNFYICIK